MYDDIYTCKLSVYIDVVCDDKLEKLIIKGNPTCEELEEARFKLTSGFSELSNNAEAQVLSETVSNLYYNKNLLLGYELSLKLVFAGRYESAIEYLNNNGLTCNIPENEEELLKLVKKIKLKIKNRTAKFKEAKSLYDAISSEKGEKPTRRYYNKLLVMLSVCDSIKIQLNPKKMTVAEFAEYLNMYNEYINHLKMNKNA